jgi:hypothetical protein
MKFRRIVAASLTGLAIATAGVAMDTSPAQALVTCDDLYLKADVHWYGYTQNWDLGYYSLALYYYQLWELDGANIVASGC